MGNQDLRSKFHTSECRPSNDFHLPHRILQFENGGKHVALAIVSQFKKQKIKQLCNKSNFVYFSLRFSGRVKAVSLTLLAPAKVITLFRVGYPVFFFDAFVFIAAGKDTKK